MQRAKLIIGEKEVLLEDGITTIGRASDNKVQLNEDFNVSRYHAEIEHRDGRFWLTDLRSSNGTSVNGVPVTTTVELFDGDLIVLGGTSQIRFCIEKEEQKEVQKQEDRPFSAEVSPTTVETPKVGVKDGTAGASKNFLSTSVLVGLFLILVFIFGGTLAFFLYGSLSKPVCQAKAKIISPEDGDLIDKETEVNIEVQNSECIDRLIVLLDDEQIAVIEQQPFVIVLNPADFPEFADGLEHSLKLVVEDSNGSKSVVDTVFVALETASFGKQKETAFATDDQSLSSGEGNLGDNNASFEGSRKSHRISLFETQQAIQGILKQFSGSFSYKFDEQFLREVQRKTDEYAEEGYFSRAESYRDLINIEFHKENGLEAPLGFLLAMSRSKFNPQKQGNKEGLWQLSDEFLNANGYRTLCPGESLSDKNQSCAAKTAAVYTKALFLKVFNGDLVYAVSAFGMSEKEAFSWAMSLPANRADFWKIIKKPEQRENLVRFFAAAIVAENPQKFNLKKDRPISELYRSLIHSSNR